MEQTHSDKEQAKIWDIISDASAAVLVTVASDGRLDARPMGCVQRDFDGALWFMTFSGSPKLDEIAHNHEVLVSYADPRAFEFVAVSGRALVVRDADMAQRLWSEAFRVWFPKGPTDPDLALIEIEVESAKYWTNAASSLTYGLAYLNALFRGRRPREEQITESKQVHFDR